MPRTIKFTIHRDGTVESEFSGFVGDECLQEAEALKAALRVLGLRPGPEKIRMKTESEIEQEIGRDIRSQAERQRARVGHGGLEV